MPGVKKGELKVSQIRELARGLNHILEIKAISTASRASLIKQIEAKGYSVDHANNKLVKGGKTKVPKAPMPKEVVGPKQARRKALVKAKPGRGPSKADVVVGKIALGTGKKAKLPEKVSKKKTPMKAKKLAPSKGKAVSPAYDEI